MRVFIAGASGAIGRRLVPLLTASGHEVIGTTRNTDKAVALRQLGVEPVVMDGLDRDAVLQAVADAVPDVVIQEQTALSGKMNMRKFDQSFAATNKLRTDGTEYLLEAAVEAGALRFLAQSYTGWPNAREGGPIKTEDDPLDATPPKAMRETLEAIRQQERLVIEAKTVEGLALRYGTLYAPGTAMVKGREYVEAIRKRRFPIIGDGDGIWSFVHIDDAAQATALAATQGGRGAYNLVDDEPAPVSVWLPYLADAIGAKPPMRVPLFVGRLAAGEVGVSMLTQIRGSANGKAKHTFGWQLRYPSWREGFVHGLDDEPLLLPPRNLSEVKRD
ncbi:MAG: NAD(P)-dependent oxidoreductase [Actinobacteria bacterium]|nr:NAD(P)-dependent oxidoreductase [Actinomycetota bacterium]